MLTVNVRPPLKRAADNPKRRLKVYMPGIDPASGYGRLGMAILEALDADLVDASEPPDVALCHPGGLIKADIRFTMWEPTELPDVQKGYWSTPALIVPCRSNAEIFRRSGYRGHIRVVNLWGEAPAGAIDTTNGVKFLCVARDNGVRERKGIDVLIECFKEAFPSESDVSLTIKQSPYCFIREPNDNRITMINEDWSKDRYEQLLLDHHCGVFISGMEAWNFPACELMAAGRPSIIVPVGGPEDFATPMTSWHLDYEWVPAPSGNPYHRFGLAAKASPDSVVKALREAYSNRDMLKEKGRISQEVAKQFTKQRFAERLRVVTSELLSIL